MKHVQPFYQVSRNSLTSDFLNIHTKLKKNNPSKKPIQKFNRVMHRNKSFSIPIGW